MPSCAERALFCAGLLACAGLVPAFDSRFAATRHSAAGGQRRLPRAQPPATAPGSVWGTRHARDMATGVFLRDDDEEDLPPDDFPDDEEDEDLAEDLADPDEFFD
ncbi:hypothetical protein T492DRAFT_855860, partial [Pavlovales sp. CCMP2436]